MMKQRLKPMLIVALVACAAGGITAGLAWATPSVGLSTTIISGPTFLDEVHVVSEVPRHGVLLMTRGESDAYVVQNKIVPGGNTGWHSHPGPSIISVVSGQVTEYRSDAPQGIVHVAGTAFVDEGGDHAHILVNQGTTDLVLAAFQIVPRGAPRRIDEPAP